LVKFHFVKENSTYSIPLTTKFKWVQKASVFSRIRYSKPKPVSGVGVQRGGGSDKSMEKTITGVKHVSATTKKKEYKKKTSCWLKLVTFLRCRYGATPFQ